VNTVRKIENGRRLLWKLRRKIHNRIGRLSRRRERIRRIKYGKEENTSCEGRNAGAMIRVVRRIGESTSLPFYKEEAVEGSALRMHFLKVLHC
jgi:hypothetical protein